MNGIINRQVIVTWYTPDEKLPPEDTNVICTINGAAENLIFDHATEILAWCKDEGWYSFDHDFVELDVLAWCDLEPYGNNNIKA